MKKKIRLVTIILIKSINHLFDHIHYYYLFLNISHYNLIILSPSFIIKCHSSQLKSSLQALASSGCTVNCIPSA